MNQELLLILWKLKQETKVNEITAFPYGICLEVQRQKIESSYCRGIECENCILTRHETGIEHTLEKLNE